VSAENSRQLMVSRLLSKNQVSRIQPRAHAGGRAPLSYAQQRLWFLQQLDPASAQYNLPAAVRIDGPLDVAALEESFSEILRRHESLRTVFPIVDGEPMQLVMPNSAFQLPITGILSEAEALLRIQESGAEVFDLESGPLFRAEILRLHATRHILLLNAHHTVSDSWSAGILVREIVTLYEAFLRGLRPSLPVLPLRYSDYAAWQRDPERESVIRTHLEYWQKRLSGELPVLELRSDHPRSSASSTRGALRKRALPAALARELRLLSRREDATLFMTLLSGFKVLLARYTNQDDIIVGSPVAGRQRPETHGVIGCFVNTLPLRTSCAGDPSFTDLLRRVRQTCLEAYAHEEAPFERVIRAVQPERDLSRTPLFQVAFGLRQDPVREYALGATRFEMLEAHSGMTKFDLMLEVIESREDLTVAIEYSSDLFETASIDRMLGHYETLLTAAVSAPGTPIGLLPLLTADEEAEIRAWNATERAYPLECCLHEFIERQADRTPDAKAIVFESEALTYRELEKRANQLAHLLRARGAGPNTLVGIAMERSVELVVALLAVLKSGAAYVPIDPEYPADRIAHMLEDANPPVLLTQQRLSPMFNSYGEKVIAVDTPGTFYQFPEERPLPVAAPDNYAYVIFTSGSTGRPKGAINTHRGIVNRLCWMQEEYGLNAGDRVLQKTPFSFDVSVWEFFWPLMTGATLVVARPGGHRDAAYLARLIADERITTLHFVPSMLQIFLEEPLIADCKTLRRVICSGEALPVELERRFFRQLDAELHNLYGPTEAAVDVTSWRCRPASSLATVPIGRPIANTQIHLLDSRMNPVPAGVAGELCIGGLNVGLGYLNRSELTAEKFVPDPFRDAPGAHMYRTGDLARYMADGAIEYLGRLDHQVKIRGFRIELGEIEAVLNQHPAVRESVVVAVEHATGEKRLAAYLVPAGDEPVDVAKLSAHLRVSLPDYMVPATFNVLHRLPLSPNGKVDRRALPAPEITPCLDDSTTTFDPPRTFTEELLAQLWCAALGVDRVSRGDDFFHLGGHSLLAAQLASRIRTTMRVDLPVRRIFEHSTLAALAASIDGDMREDPHPAIPRRAPASESQLSFAQQRLWILDQLSPGDVVYHLPLAVRIDGALHYEALEKALEFVVSRHESLRTHFIARDGVPVQVIAAESDAPIDTVDLQSVMIQDALLDHVRTPFDLGNGPLIRARLLRVSEMEHVLSIVMHHIVSDGWSVDVMLRELTAAYGAYASGRLPDLKPLPIQYADYAAWQRERLEGSSFGSQMNYWRRQLENLPMLNLPSDRPRPRVQRFRGARRSATISPAIAEQVTRLARQQNATTFMVLLAGFQALLARYTAQNDIATGTPVANRNQTETEGLIGFFVNTLVLRTRLDGDPSFTDIVSRVQEVCLGAYTNQDLPFERIVEELRPERHLDANPLFQVMFTVRETGSTDLRIPDAAIKVLEPPEGISKFDLTLEVELGKAEFRAAVEYDTALFDAATIDSLILNFETLLGAAAADPARPLSELAVINDPERCRMLTEWNLTRTDYPREASIPGLFREITQQNPAATALEFDGRVLTYQELDRRSSQIANGLRRLGVTERSFVGLSMRRSAAMVAATLGILKAGCAYVPLDISYPAERLRLMLSESSVQVVLADAEVSSLLSECADGRRIIALGEDCGEFAGESETAGHADIGPEHTAYVMFTSGSTGQPKGILVPHRAIVRLVRNTDYVALGAGDRIAQVSNISFDAATFEIWGALLNGAALVGISKETALDPAGFADALREKGVTTMFVTTALFNLMARELPDGFRSLKNLLFGGEAADADAVRRVLRWGKPARLMNVYGPTETTTFASWFLIEDLPEDATSVPIGRPLANTTFYVLDANRQPVPVGVPGELYIGGDGVASGYLNRPKLEAGKFVADWFSASPAARLYRTGDLVRYRRDGAVEFLGRIDDQVKIRGFRIEPGEIDAALTKHPAVHQAMTIVREDAPGDKRLVSYCVAAAGHAIDPRDLRSFLSAQLPEYMLPATFVEMELFPVNVNGKVDRSLLPAPESRPADATREVAAPRTPTERGLCAIWADLLGSSQISIDDNFFAIGGHSLLATQVVSRIRDLFRIELPLRALFEHQTIADLALHLGSCAAMDEGPIPPRNDPGAPAPLSWSQQRVWFLEQLMPGTALYNVPAMLRFRGHLNVQALQQAFSAVVNRHDVLRATFEVREGVPVQVCSASDVLQLSNADLSGLEEAERERELGRLAREEARRPFDLATGPLIRTTLVRLGASEHVLLLVMHHIVCDGWSIGVMIREAVRMYQDYARGAEPNLPALQLQYADYAAWQRGAQSNQIRDSKLAWWAANLSGELPALDLPTDRPRKADGSMRGAKYRSLLNPALLGNLKTLAAQQDATLFMVLLSAFNALLARLTGQRDIIVGSPIAGRTRAELEGLIGFFVNTLPLRTDLSGDPTFSELLQRVRETTLGAYAHQEVPFEMLVNEVAPDRSRNQNPLFQVALVLENAADLSIDVPGLTVEIEEIDAGYAKFDLTLVAQETKDGLSLSWEYLADLFDEATIRCLADDFEKLSGWIAANPQGRISDLPSISTLDHRHLIRLEPATLRTEQSDISRHPETEEKLIAIWQDVLGLLDVGIHDNFFEIGGDSILSIQVIARAHAAGLDLTPREMFDNQTIATLASVARSAPAANCPQEPVTGPAVLTPIQRWFFEQELTDAHHWNQSVLLKLAEAPAMSALEEAFNALILHHDALRSRFHRSPAGWSQEIAPPDQPVSLMAFDLRNENPDARAFRMEQIASETQASIDLTQGPLLRAVVFQLGDQEWRLLIVIHHLAVDGVSWRILLEDLHSAYDALRNGKPVRLVPKTTSWPEWGERLSEYAKCSELQNEAGYWLTTACAPHIRLPADSRPDPSDNTRAACASAAVTLTPEETAQLLREVPRAWRTQINDVLLTALVAAFRRWTGENTLLIDLESHGRDALPAGPDVSRTVGWFTSAFPVRLTLADGRDVGRALGDIKEQLRRVPRNGAGYGVLRYLGSVELAAQLASAPIPEVSFNYLGQFDQSFAQARLFSLAAESRGPELSPRSGRRNLLEFIGNVQGGRLHITCVYSRLIHRRTTVETVLDYFLEELRAIITHCIQPDAGGLTVSDFPLAKLDHRRLANLARVISKTTPERLRDE